MNFHHEFTKRKGRCLLRKLTYETVYDEIKRRITTGVWPPGTRLPPLEELSEELGVGVSSVREAVRILGKQHILRIEQGRGTFVCDALKPSPAETFDFLEAAGMQQLTEARSLLEPQLAALAARRASEEEIQALLKSARGMAAKVERGEDFLEEDLAFHELIAKAAGNDVLCGMLALIADLLVDSRRRSMKWPGMDERAASYHTLIAHAIAQRNPEQARLLMQSHMDDMLEELRKR